MRWDPVTTLRRALWIGGAQWAGKTTVAGILAGRYGLTHYHYDYHDARGHLDRRLAHRARRGLPDDLAADSAGATPEELADQARAVFAERFECVQDDLRALVSPRPIIADGWGLRPSLVATVTDDPGRMVVLVPGEAFREAQAARLARARTGGLPGGGVDRARIARDRILAEDVVVEAGRAGVRVIEVDGSRDAEGVADLVAEHFAAYLPPPERFAPP